MLVALTSSVTYAETLRVVQATVAPSTSGGAIAYEIPAGSLGRALTQFAEQSGVQLVYSASLTGKLSSPGLSGRYTPRDALTKLLEGTGLVYRFTDSRNVTVEKAPSTSGTRTLGPVRVEGRSETATSGINGSTDPTATEGTGSYTSGALTIASKAPQSIKDTPQTVSVITEQRMRDQNITDFRSLMDQATGVSVVTGANGPSDPTFYSRGFEVQRLQVDGGAPQDISRSNNSDFSLVPQIDMAAFDHAEVLRGADGIFNGYGSPGGVISLTRKRPLNHPQATFDGELGSWSNTRVVIDATAPLGFDGKLRGRGVIAYQDQNYFYDTAASNKTIGYGILEYDLFPTTVLGAGFSSTRQNTVPFYSGLPRYQSGADLKLPRNTCLCFPWSRLDFDTDEVFGRIDQALGEEWSLKLNLTQTEQERHYKYGYVQGTVNPVTLAGPAMGARMGDRATRERAADLTLNGSFELLGHRQLLTVGTNYARADGTGFKSYSDPNTAGPPVAVFGFNPGSPAYSEPASVLPTGLYPEYGTTQWGAYSTLRLTFWNPLHLNLGLRYSHYEFGSVQQSLCNRLAGCTDKGVTYAAGQVMTTTVTRYDTNDLSWPPAWSLIYDLSNALSVYGSYSDIYQQQATLVARSGQSIDPITGSNVEGGIKWSGREGRLNATLALYRVEKKNFGLFLDYGDYQSTSGLLPDGIHSCCYSNDLDQTYTSKGIDGEVTGEVLPGWQLAAGYTYNKNWYQGAATRSSEGKPLNSILPRQLFKLWSSYQFQTGEWLRRLNVGGGVNGQSKGYIAGTACVRYRIDAHGNSLCDVANGGSVNYEFTQSFYAVFSARIAYEIDSRWSAALSVNNVTDRVYYQTVGSSSGNNWYGEPRNFMLTMRGSF